MAASTGQFGGVERKNLAVGGEGQNFRGRLREKRRLQRVVALIGQGGHIGDMTLQRANPALLRNHDGDRLALDHRFRQIEVPGLRRVLESRAPRPELRLQAERLLQLADLRGDGAPLLGFVGEQPLDLGALLGQLRMFLAQLHFLQLAQGAQAGVENIVGLHVRELERGFQRALASSSSLMMRITSSRLRKTTSIPSSCSSRRRIAVSRWRERRSSTSRR